MTFSGQTINTWKTLLLKDNEERCRLNKKITPNLNTQIFIKNLEKVQRELLDQKKSRMSSIQVDDQKGIPCKWVILPKRLSIQDNHLLPPAVQQ